MAIETVGAKIRNRLSPYKTFVYLAEEDPEKAVELLKDRVDLHKRMVDELVELSKECEIEPSDKWDKYGD